MKAEEMYLDNGTKKIKIDTQKSQNAKVPKLVITRKLK